MFEGSVSSIPSILAYMNSWLNPHFFFLLLNLMIGTIVFTSTSNNRHQNQQQSPQITSTNTIGSEEFHDPELDSVQDSGTHFPQTQLTNFEKEQDETAPTSDDVYVPTSTTAPEALVRSKGRMKKSVSMKAETITRLEAEEDEETIESRRPATAREGTGKMTEKDEYGVDEKADDFINRFKQQLRLQRMDSIGRQREIGGQKVS